MSNMARIHGPLMVIIGAICIGFAPIGMRYGLDDLGPQALAFWRYALALPGLMILLLINQAGLPARPNRYVIGAALFFTLDVALWHWALDITTVANATFLVNLGNIGLGLLAWIVLKEKPAPIWFVAVILASAGAAGLAFGGGATGASVLRGDLLAMGAAIMVACYMLFSKLARGQLSGLETILWLTVFEALFCSIIVALSGEPFFPAHISGLAAPLFLAVIVQIAGQGLIITGLGHISAAMAGILVIIQPVVAAVLAWLLFKEPLSALQMGGAALIIVAIWFSQYKKPRS